jgi:zinc protease
MSTSRVRGSRFRTQASRWLLGSLLALACAPQAGPSPVTAAAAPAGNLALAGTVAPGSATSPPGATPAPSAELPLDPQVLTGKLKSGVTYYLERHETKDRRAHLMLVVRAGSLHEDDDQRGMAHFVEHMAFSGTRRFAKQSLVDFFERSGLTFGSHANASTSFDRTEYMLSVPTDDPKLLPTALDVLEDWAAGISFEPDQVQKERQVLLSEWTSSRGAARRVGDQQRQLLLMGSRYVDRDIIGDRSVLETGPRQRLVDFYQRWYRPEQMAVIGVGDIDPQAVKAAVAERFDKLTASTLPAPPPNGEIPVGKEPSAAIITDPETPALEATVLFKSRGHALRTVADYREQLTAAMAAQMLDRRLGEIVQRPEAPFTGASSGMAQGVFGKLDLMQVGARAKQGQLAASFDTLLSELERVKRHGFTAPELERTRREYARFLDHQVAAQETAEGQAIAAGLANLFVVGDAVMAPEFQRSLGVRLLGELGLPEVNGAVGSRLQGSEEVLIASGATRDAMPEKASLLAALAASSQKPVQPYQEAAVEERLMVKLPEPGRIVAEQRIPEIGVIAWTLSNGARVVIRPTDFKNDQIVEQSVSFGGNRAVPAKDLPSARLAHEIVAAGGVQNLDQQALSKFLADKVVSVYPWIDEQDEGIRASAAPKDVETMFQLMYLYVTAPRRDPAAFEAYRAAVREGLRNRDLNPNQLFSEAIARKLYGDAPRRLPLTAAAVDALDLDSAFAFYRQRFADVSDFTFVFVGKIDEASFKPLVERYLASLPGGGRKETYHDLGLHRQKGISQVTVKAGKEDKASVMFLFHGETPRWSENAHTDLTSLESYLSIRLREVLREQLGGVYTPYVQSSFERIPVNEYSLVVAFDCKPADIDKLEQATRQVLTELEKNGAAPSYIEKLTNQRTRSLEEAYRSNDFWLERLVDKYKLREDPRQILILHDLTKRVTSENLQKAARTFARSDQYLEAKLLPGE